MDKMGKTKDGHIPVKGDILYRIWDGQVECITVLSFEIAYGATQPTVSYKEDGRTIQTSADIFYQSLHHAWKDEKEEYMEFLEKVNETIAGALRDQLMAIAMIRKADNYINSFIA